MGDSTQLIVGNTYVITHRRKGTFTGKIVLIDGEWIDVEITQGTAHFLSDADAGPGDVITVRNGLITVRAA